VLAEQVECIKGDGANIAEAHLKEGPAVDELRDLAEEVEAGLIVIGSRGLGSVKRLLLGSVVGSGSSEGSSAVPSSRVLPGCGGKCSGLMRSPNQPAPPSRASKPQRRLTPWSLSSSSTSLTLGRVYHDSCQRG